jgi:hypothetical protein
MLADELEYVVGVDTHLEEHVLAVVAAATGAVLARQVLRANKRGYQAALRFAGEAAHGARAWAVEGTGSYGAGLARYLAGRGETVLESSRTPRTERRLRGKDDALDAARTARAALASEALALRRNGERREAVSILVSPIGATANSQPSRKVKRDRPQSAIVGVSASAAERHGSRIDPGRVSPRLRLAAACATPTTRPRRPAPAIPREPSAQPRPCSRSPRCHAVSGLRRDGEAEHHPALVVLGYVTVRHPETRLAHVQEDVDGLPGPDEHRVLPNQIRLDKAVSAQDEKAARAVDMERVMHRMVGLHLVDEPDLDLVADVELPVDGGVLSAGFPIDDQPAHIGRRRLPVQLDHVVFPFDAFRSAVRMASLFAMGVVLLVVSVVVFVLAVAMAVTVLFVPVHVVLSVSSLP